MGAHLLLNSSGRQICSGLPPFLVATGGLNSGFMMTHVTAAALVSENKVLVHPASSDSISTSAAKEDHVANAAYAARKALTIVINVERILAIELMAACQALDFLRPLRSTPQVCGCVRTRECSVVCFSSSHFMARVSWRCERPCLRRRLSSI